PFIHIGLFTLCYMNRTPSSHFRINIIIKKFKSIQIMQVPPQRTIFTVYFESKQSLVTTGVTCSLKKAKGAIIKMAMEQAGVINLNFLLFTCFLVNTFLDKSLS